MSAEDHDNDFPSLLATPAGQQLLKHIQEIGRTHPQDALRLLDVVLGTAEVAGGGSGVRAEGAVRGDGKPPAGRPARVIQVPQEAGSTAPWAFGDGVPYKGPQPRKFAQQRHVKSRRAYTADRMPSRSALNQLTPAQQKILYALVESKQPLSVDQISSTTELAVKTVENSLSLLRSHKLITTH